MRSTKKQQQQPTLVVATLRCLVFLWPSNSPCAVPELHAGTQKTNFGCLLLQLPAAYQGGTLSVWSTSEGGKVEAHDLSARSEDLFHAASFYTDGVSHSIAPVTAGIMPFLLYDLHRTEACVHVPSPASYARHTAGMENLVNEWVADEERRDMYAFALSSKSRRIRDLMNGMSKRDKSYVQLLKDCANLSVFIVMMSNSVTGDGAPIQGCYGYTSSDIQEITAIENVSKWYTLDQVRVPVQGAHDKSVKDRHMLERGAVFEDDRDWCNKTDDYNEHTFFRNVVVFCATDRLAHMALSLSLETARNFVQKGLCAHADLMAALREHKGARKGSGECWVDMVNIALSDDCKTDVVSLLTLLNSWQASDSQSYMETERDEDEGDEYHYVESDANVLRDERIVKAVLQVASVYGGDEAIMSSIAQLVRNVDKYNVERCAQLVAIVNASTAL